MSAADSCDVLIVGGGPVGLLLGNLLGARGVRVTIAEKRTRLPEQSMAIGITPPSLEIMAGLGLDGEFTRAGVAVKIARAYENGELVGTLDFSTLPTRFAFFLSLPQARTIELLRGNLRKFGSVKVRDGWEFRAGASGTGATSGGMEAVFESSQGMRRVEAAWIVGADGHRSGVRAAAGIRSQEHTYKPTFVMADFKDRTDFGAEARLYFGAERPIESFPLPGGWRRWIVLERGSGTDEALSYIVEQVRSGAGCHLTEDDARGFSRFTPRRMSVDRYSRGRVVLAGDAAHVMSPIGGQGMNTGFADAACLAEVLVRLMEKPGSAPMLLAAYERMRRKAADVAANRAARGMWLGTRTGRRWSAARKLIVRRVLFGLLGKRLGPYFAMLTLPGWQGRWSELAPGCEVVSA